MKSGLSIYRVQIKEKGADGWWTVQRSSPQDAFAEFRQYFHDRKGTLVRLGDMASDGTYLDQRALLLTRATESDQGRMLAGMFLKGESGVVREIRDFDDPEGDPVYQTKVHEGVLTPLYCRFHFQDGKQFGICLMQSMGIEGLKGYVEKDLRRYFDGAAGSARTVRLTQWADRKVLEQFAKKGALQDVVLVNTGKNARSRAAMQRNTIAGSRLNKDGDKMELRLARRGGFGAAIIRRLWHAAEAKEGAKGQIDVKGFGEVDDIKVEIEFRGRTQTFSLLNPDDSPPRLDISDHIVKDPKTGLPTWDSVHAAAGAA